MKEEKQEEREQFEKLFAKAVAAIPEKFRLKLKNVAFLIEDEPNEEVRRSEGLEENETLFGLYQGVPLVARGEGYGIGATLPDTITLYRIPIMEESLMLGGGKKALTRIIEETLWHEIAHYFGYGEREVFEREMKRGKGPVKYGALN